ncbi:MAG: tetratricopeptide repeat protein [Acidobacteria bacterium]|nr:tetratricopeptide repeat protein [Acidobacteriota bacterium]MBV9482387.1 tetratricopeptide repeat protein [Acidobacteriota bacterium]
MRAETRHSLKEDRFSRVTIDAAGKTMHWSAEHRKALAIAGVVTLAVVVAGLGGWYYFNQQDEKASVEFSQAIRTLDTQLRPPNMPGQPGIPSFTSAEERATAAHKQFQAVGDKYPHTRAGEFATYFAGVTASTMGDTATAERELKRITSSRDKDLSALAKFALASVYRKMNRPKEAIDLYKQLTDHPTASVGKSMAQLELADFYQDQQQNQQAKRIYEQLEKDNPNTEVASIASSKLAALK